MVFGCFSLDELISYAKAVDNAWKEIGDSTAARILASAGQSSVTDPDDQRLRMLQTSVSRRTTEKASQNTLNNALLELLLARLKGRRLKTAHLKGLSGCHLVISRLRELRVFPHGDHIRWVKEIHRLNPEIKWHFLVLSGGVGKINDPELLDGLRGSLDACLKFQSDFCELQKIAAMCHPDFRMKLEIQFLTDVLLQNILDSRPILKHLAKLTATVHDEQSFRALDAVCKDYKFDMALAISDGCRLLSTCSHVPSSLVDLQMLSPTADELLWVEQIGNQQSLTISINGVSDIQTVSNLTNSRLVLRNLDMQKPLRSERDVFLFKQICKAHPNMVFSILLERADPVKYLRDLPMGMDVNLDSTPIYCRAWAISHPPDADDDDCHYRAVRWQPTHAQQNLVISTYADRLLYLKDLDLSRTSQICLRLTDAVFDYKLMAEICGQCPNLEEFALLTDFHLTEHLVVLSRILQETIDNRTWPSLQSFTIYSPNHEFFALDLPNFTKVTSDNMWQWRKEY